MNQPMSERNSFYNNGIILLSNKFLNEVKDSDSELMKMHEGLERTFEFWADKYIKKSEEKMKEDIWKIIIKKLVFKNG